MSAQAVSALANAAGSPTGGALDRKGSSGVSGIRYPGVCVIELLDDGKRTEASARGDAGTKGAHEASVETISASAESATRLTSHLRSRAGPRSAVRSDRG